MPDRNNPSQGANPAPDWRQHPLPRRVSPENSVTLRHHRLARDASMKEGPGPSVKTSAAHTKTSRRNSSGESHATGNSDPNTWFDQSNENPGATFNGPLMDVDPPFFQKETDMSYDESTKEPQLYPFDSTTAEKPHLPPTVTQSSSADDYRSVIDDLTIEIQRLKEELKRYKRNDPGSLKKEKLFEIKVHGLGQRKKRELEATLREFAASLDGTTSAGASSQRKKSARHPTQMYSASGSNSKHSSSGSNSRPVDSAYASASTGRNSSGTSGRPSITSSRQRTADQKVESYLREIPEGLYPRHMVMTDKDRKKLVVRRLEHLFTGKLSKRSGRAPPTGSILAPVTTDNSGASSATHQPPSLEPAREARIIPSDVNKKGGRSRDNGSTSNSNGDQTESGGNGSGTANGVGIVTGTGSNTSPPTKSPPEQRPTRPRDLDPDRIQIPSENMEYIRHLGLVPPELLQKQTEQNVSPDADGWVYLNLLCNLAQLHMFNVTPDYIRAAVSEKSTKFQMSADGRKIRWRGGQDGTKFSSDSSGDNSQKSPSTDDTDASKTETQRRKHKTEHQLDDAPSARLSSSKNTSKLGHHLVGSSESFHYQPLFAKRTISQDSSRDDTESSVEVGEESNGVGSRWGFSGSGSSQRKKRRFNGGITYYSGAPFCTDLSGDTGDVSPTTYMVSSREQQQQSASTGLLSTQMSVGADTDSSLRPQPSRTTSGSWLKIRPLSDENFTVGEEMDMDEEAHPTHEGLLMDDSDLDCDMPWSDSGQKLRMHELEASGLGGIMPEDHFVVVVATRRPKRDEPAAKMTRTSRTRFDVTADAIIGRLASMSTSSPRSPRQYQSSSLQSERSSRSTSPSAVAIEYVQGRIRRLSPTPLPPPAAFFRENSESSDEEGDELEGFSSEQEADALLSEGFMSRRANPHLSDNPYPEDEDITSADEAGEEPEEDDHALKQREAEMPDLKDTEEGESEASDVEGKLGRRKPAGGSVAALTGSMRSKSIRSKSADVGEPVASSLATAGGAGSGYSSGEESEK